MSNWANQTITAANLICINPSMAPATPPHRNVYFPTPIAAPTTCQIRPMSSFQIAKVYFEITLSLERMTLAAFPAVIRRAKSVVLFNARRENGRSVVLGFPTTTQQPRNLSETDAEAIAQMEELIYREAHFRSVSYAVETVES
ncbi:hypothetical protein R6Q59_031140 [Mikania micrantha]